MLGPISFEVKSLNLLEEAVANMQSEDDLLEFCENLSLSPEKQEISEEIENSQAGGDEIHKPNNDRICSACNNELFNLDMKSYNLCHLQIL